MIERYNQKQVEKEIIEFWDKNKIYQKVKEKNKGKKKYYFLDGPPYTSGSVHIGTAWNKALKDMVLRYKRMQGFDVWDRAGYDMHGLPIEHAVQEKFGLMGKDDIEKVGVQKFIEECRNFAIENMHLMNRDFKRIGVWMDFENAYQSITKDFIEGEWWLVKRAHEKKRLYEGKKTMPWCPSCASANAKHELNYKVVNDKSIFLKFKIIGTENEYLIIWTTTPWTIPYNLGVMVNPEIEYAKCKVGDEVWIIAKQLAAALIQTYTNYKCEIIDVFLGEKLKGLEYKHPFEKELKKVYDELRSQSKKIHTVVLSTEYVDTSAGSGLVHMAPGCGPEDYEVGIREGIPPFNNLDEQGYFPKEMEKFAGWKAKEDDDKFIEELDKKGALIATSVIEHEYPHCWRCHTAVIFRTTKQWFFKIEDLKENMKELNREIKWVPDAAFNAFDSWLNNLRDNGITKQRYWGCPIPLWKCQKCGSYDVFENAQELKKKSGKVPEDLHKPYIDEVKYKCECGGIKERIPDVLDVWVDAGTTSWNCIYYPKNDKLFKEMFPADFILEGKDQIRGWFNLLMVASMVSMEKPSFKAVYMHGFINDALGRKMSKSLKNYILPDEVIDEYGADTMRYYMIGAANPGVDMSYNFDDMKVKFKNIGVFWNLHKFIIDMSENLGAVPNSNIKNFGIEEEYIFSRLNSTIREATEKMDNYLLNEIPSVLEKLFLDLSRVYIQMKREKSNTGTEEEKKLILDVCFEVFFQCLKMFAIVSPFITEKIYLNLKERFKLKEESIHLYSWPKADDSKINLELERSIELCGNVVSVGLAMRENLNLGVRWPIGEAIIVNEKEDELQALKKMEDLIKIQLNVKKIKFENKLELPKKVRSDYNKIGPLYGELAPKIIAKLAVESPESILKKIDEKGSYDFELEGKEVSIKRDYLLIENEYPKEYIGGEFRHGFILLSKKRTKELDNEGYAREVSRRVQSLRKKAGLQKNDLIDLEIKVEGDCSLFEFEEFIRERTNSTKIKVVKSISKKNTDSFEIKNVKFTIGLEKI